MKSVRVFIICCLSALVPLATFAEPPALGVKFICPYMPYSLNASQLIYLSNPTTNAVDISVTAFDESGRTCDLGVVATANGRTNIKLHTLLAYALDFEGFNRSKICYEIDVPNSEVTAFFGYINGGYHSTVQAHRELYPLSGQSGITADPPDLGVKITCPYMLYAPGAAQIIYVSNTGSLDCDLNIIAFDHAGVSYDLGSETINSKTVTNLAPILSTKLSALGFTGGKLTYVFDSNKPEVYAFFAYTDATGRVSLPHQRALYVLPATP